MKPNPVVIRQYLAPINGVPITRGLFQNITNVTPLRVIGECTHSGEYDRDAHCELCPCPVIGRSIVSNHTTNMRIIINQLWPSIPIQADNERDEEVPHIYGRVY